MEFRKIIEDLDHFQTIMMVEMKDNPELSCTIEKFSNNLHKIYDEVCFLNCQVSIRDPRSKTDWFSSKRFGRFLVRSGSKKKISWALSKMLIRKMKMKIVTLSWKMKFWHRLYSRWKVSGRLIQVFIFDLVFPF